MKTVRNILILIAVIVAAFVLLRPGGEPAPMADIRGLPWQIETLPNGNSRVFGLELPVSTLDQARGRYGDAMKLGIVAAQGEPGALEAYYDSVTAGVIHGRMILLADLDAQTLSTLRERSVKREHMNDSTFRYALHRDDLDRALRAPIAGVTFIPAADLDEAMVVKRFGPPQERLPAGEHGEHFLYPALGLDLLLDAKGKEVLQYVAPREFQRLRDPLFETAGARDRGAD